MISGVSTNVVLISRLSPEKIDSETFELGKDDDIMIVPMFNDDIHYANIKYLGFQISTYSNQDILEFDNSSD